VPDTMYKDIKVLISATGHGRLALKSIPLRELTHPLASIPPTPEPVIDLIIQMVYYFVCEQRTCRPRVECSTQPVMDNDTVSRDEIPSEACTELELSGREGGLGDKFPWGCTAPPHRCPFATPSAIPAFGQKTILVIHDAHDE
jgi:hypothetical protein